MSLFFSLHVKTYFFCSHFWNVMQRSPPPPPPIPLSPPLLEERWIISHRAAVRKTKENRTNYNYNGKNIRTNRSWSYEKYKKIRQSCDGDWASLKQDSDIVWLNWCDHAQLDTDWIRNCFLTLRNAQFLSFWFHFFNIFFLFPRPDCLK